MCNCITDLLKQKNIFGKKNNTNFVTIIPLPLPIEFPLTCENIKKHNLSNDSFCATTNVTTSITNIKTKIPFT